MAKDYTLGSIAEKLSEIGVKDVIKDDNTISANRTGKLSGETVIRYMIGDYYMPLSGIDWDSAKVYTVDKDGNKSASTVNPLDTIRRADSLTVAFLIDWKAIRVTGASAPIVIRVEAFHAKDGRYIVAAFGRLNYKAAYSGLSDSSGRGRGSGRNITPDDII